MVRKLSTLIVLTLFILGCQKDRQGPLETAKGNNSFSVYEDHFLDALWKLDPDRATSVGYHKYDSLLVIPDDKSRDKLLTFAKVQIDSLSRFEVNTLIEANRIDHHLMQNEMERIQWNIQQLKAWQW